MTVHHSIHARVRLCRTVPGVACRDGAEHAGEGHGGALLVGPGGRCRYPADAGADDTQVGRPHGLVRPARWRRAAGADAPRGGRPPTGPPVVMKDDLAVAAASTGPLHLGLVS